MTWDARRLARARTPLAVAARRRFDVWAERWSPELGDATFYGDPASTVSGWSGTAIGVFTR